MFSGNGYPGVGAPRSPRCLAKGGRGAGEGSYMRLFNSKYKNCKIHAHLVDSGSDRYRDCSPLIGDGSAVYESLSPSSQTQPPLRHCKMGKWRELLVEMKGSDGRNLSGIIKLLRE